MPCRDIVVIGASAGGVEALSQIVQVLPLDLSAALFVVVHFPSYSTSFLPQILNRYGSLIALHPQDGEQIQLGRIYVAPPDYHLVVKRDRIRLSHDPRQNGHRPAIDRLFSSAARAYGSRVIGVILSGMLDDGTAGLAVIKARGGVAIVQDPVEALFDSMPRSAIKNVKVDCILKLTDIASTLVEITRDPLKEEDPVSDDLEADTVAQDKAALERGERPGQPSPLTCPSCGGVLWELQDGNLIRFRCHVGHAYSTDSLMAEQADTVETALWSAVRALEEKAALGRRLETQARQQNRFHSEVQFKAQAQAAERDAALVRQIILQSAIKAPNEEANSEEA
ncbi:MAG TPA: chemotaxis protein CheB [Cyanobacteria bacterium UBA8803]|nr:chemotaxis protein CheB [Cyanobacteria bacterium UBA9273]HBL62976.1 chemotaxis protein CheB [Cyanobacteria bacterium UBA8803]